MNWLKTLINRQASARRFNPGRVLAWPEAPMDDVHPQDEIQRAPGTLPGTVPQTPHAPEPVLQPTITKIALEAPAPTRPDDDMDQEALGIGACVTLP